MLKRVTAVFLCGLLVIGAFAGCGGKPEKNDKLNIVCTVFPQYDWVREIMGEKLGEANLQLLLDSGTDLHSYSPTAADLVTISTSDLFIYVGGESDKWVDDALKNVTNENMKIINMLETLGDRVYEEETKDGMQEAEHDHDHEAESEDVTEDHQFEVENDEHVWLSLTNADIICTKIKDMLCELDADNSSVYTANCGKYRQSLNVLDGDFKAAVAAGKTNMLLFGDRFPFRYLVEDYNLDYYAAFVGCSAESEASFETVAFLANKVDEYGLKCVIVTETSDKSIANTIINSTADKNQQVVVFNSLQSVTSSEVEAGQTYLKAMTDNLSALKTALS